MTGQGVLSAVPEFVAADVNDIVHAVVQRVQGNQKQLTDVLHALLLRAERSIALTARPTGVIRIRTWATEADVRFSLLANGSDGFDAVTDDAFATDLFLSLIECAKIISDHGGRMYAWRPYAGEASYTIVLPATSSPS
jgi:hypothetical protein